MKMKKSLFYTFYALPVTLILLLFQGCTTLITDDIDKTRIFYTGEKPENLEYAGDITAELRSWNWLFLTGPEERWARIEARAQTRAEELYGNDAVIKIELISGRWHPASLVMLFGLAGFVEDARIEATVWLPVPEPEPEPEPVIRYRVIPDADYSSKEEFTTVEYRDRDMLAQELERAFEQGELDEEALEKKLSGLPAGGTVFVTYGRTDITNAISRWFTFTLFYEGKEILNKKGVEDIPYVYGADNLWWNDRSCKVEIPWEGELLLIIEDTFQNREYLFRIVREEA